MKLQNCVQNQKRIGGGSTETLQMSLAATSPRESQQASKRDDANFDGSGGDTDEEEEDDFAMMPLQPLRKLSVTKFSRSIVAGDVANKRR